MAKKTVKKPLTEDLKPVKKPAASRKPEVSSATRIEKACEDVLAKLQALKIAQDLQAEIEWCLGSYRNDKNPSGLYEMGEKALIVLSQLAEGNSKAVSKKLITDLKNAVKNR
jgi:hypothetical protein